MRNNVLKVGVQMDPPELIDIRGDSTFALLLEAQKRGHELWVYNVGSLSLCLQGESQEPQERTQVTAEMSLCSVKDKVGDHITKQKAQVKSLSEMDVILMRQDPPFDMSYITATHMLDHIHSQRPEGTLVVNDPRWVRECPEKILVTYFPQLMPPTLITRDKKAIEHFRDKWKDIIIKPLYGNGGYGVFRLKEGDQNLGALLELFNAQSSEPVMVQRYLPQIKQGDKRIVLVDGEPAGAISRMPSGGEHRSNMHVGGQAQATELTERDRFICQTIGPFLREHGLIFVGIDVIGSYLTEINVTSPTGLREIERFDGTNIAGRIWDCIERKKGQKLATPS